MMMLNRVFCGVLLGALIAASCGSAQAGTQYNSFEDAAVAQAQAWQSGKKARAIMSSDGMVIFPFGQAMPRLTCSPTRACDVELEPGEKPNKVILGDSVNWTWQGAESMKKGTPVAHVVFQPKDNRLETNVIITTDRRTYHIKLYAPLEEGVYLNRVGFYYPEELVSSWEEKMGSSARLRAKEEGSNVFLSPVAVDKIDYGYRIEGNASFRPVRVLNNGEQVFIEMPSSVNTGPSPNLHLLDDKGEVMIVNYRRLEDENTKRVHYVVDRLFKRAELVMDGQKVRIIWEKADTGSGFWPKIFGGNN